MPPSGYLTVSGIEQAVKYLLKTYPAICHPVTLPEKTIEGRDVLAFRLAAGAKTERRGVLYIGGTHARELVNPDLVLSLALKLCQSYTGNTSLVFGPKVYTSGTVKLILESLDIFVIPLLNPDGRAWVQNPTGYPMWRKNRRVNIGSGCLGVDLNRNYDFLHASGIGTSASPCSDVFRGPAAFSEPETRNVRALLDANPRVRGLVDVHSYQEKIYHPWGDDDLQTTTPDQNFQNPAYNGLRGIPGDTVYKEYINPEDLDWFIQAGNSTATAIKAVRGRVYGVEQAVRLYPTSGTSKDYAYARHLVNAARSKVYAYTIETGREFQPPYSEALEIIKEVSAGLTQFAIQVMCLADATAADAQVDTTPELRTLRRVRDDVFAKSRTGREYLTLADRHSAEVIEALGSDPRLRERAVSALAELRHAVGSADGRARLSKALVSRLMELVGVVAARPEASPGLRRAAERARADLPQFADRPVGEVLSALDKRPVGPRPSRPVPVPSGPGTPPVRRRPAGAAPTE